MRVERLERQLADACECSKGEQAPQTPLERISKCAVSIVDTLVSLDRSVQEEVVEWLVLVRLEPQEIVLPIKEETVDAFVNECNSGLPSKLGDVPQFRERDRRCDDV